MIMGERKKERGGEDAVMRGENQACFENGVREFSGPSPKYKNTLPTRSLSGGLGHFSILWMSVKPGSS